ncbi:MAG: hypothetical protein AAB416_01585, partial [Patescibacteria group bacterium]
MKSSAHKRLTSILGQARYSIKERLGIAVYTRDAAYRVTGAVTFKNQEDRTCAGRVIIPIPQSIAYQKIVEPIKWEGSQVQIARDTQFGNEFAYADFSLDAHRQITWRFSCVVKVSPRSVSLSRAGTLAQYAGTPKDGFASQDPKVKARATALRGSEIQCRHILRQFNEYVIRSLRYGNPQRGLYSASDALSLPEVDCGGFDS